jgi:hypothetical protein
MGQLVGLAGMGQLVGLAEMGPLVKKPVGFAGTVSLEPPRFAGLAVAVVWQLLAQLVVAGVLGFVEVVGVEVVEVVEVEVVDVGFAARQFAGLVGPAGLGRLAAAVGFVAVVVVEVVGVGRHWGPRRQFVAAGEVAGNSHHRRGLGVSGLIGSFLQSLLSQ